MKRILSGIKPSGEITLGNYLGAMKRWAELHKTHPAEYFYFVPNLHALNTRQEPKVLADNTLSAAAWLYALGIDPAKSVVFAQSQVPAHSELCWILDNYVTMGELSRMTQFKDKSHKAGPDGLLVGLFNYPVLMAADILLYDVDEVPVGDDQKQHVELTRDIAERFNNLYGQTFKLPKPTIQESAARIMDLQDPTKKMSKSDGGDNKGCIFMTDSRDVIADKIKRAVTDSGSEIRAGQDKPAINNLLAIFSALAGKPVSKLEGEYEGKGYGDFKSDLAEVAVHVIEPLQDAFKVHMSDRDQLLSVLQQGADKASGVAGQRLAAVKAKIGLL